MKYCIECTKDTANNTLTIAGEWGIENIVFICDETQQKLICAPFVKANIAVSNSGGNTIITILSGAGVTLGSDDLMTFMIDDFKSSQDIINGVNTNVSTVSGKVDTVGGKVDTVGGKVDTVSGKVTTVDGKVDNANTALGLLDTKIGTSADTAANSTVFGKIAATKGDTETIIANLGSMAVGDLTIRGLLAAIKSDALTLQQLTAAKDAITALIGAASDSASANTVFGKIAASKAVVDAISASLGTDNVNDVHDKLNEILRVINLFAYGFAITQNNDGTETYTLDLDNSASIDDSTLNIA